MGADTMRMRLPLLTMTRLWGWAMPGLIALEPAAMALYEASSEMGMSPRACADFPKGLVRVVKDQLPSQTARNQFRVQEIGK
jgi:hypothetical protein